jgi:polypeptide N-acetylgalactosaminyltransferase
MLSRMWGASNAKGPALVFIDCHMEVMPGYLEPLLDRIARNRNSSAIPTIDGLNRETLEYDYHLDPKNYPRHGFAWNMDHTWISVPDYVRKKQNHPSEPFYSVTMLGAMFSIHKDYFKELGMYDPLYNIYGAEDVELSFKVWLCGGVLEQVPCSHAAHMFRAKFFYSVRFPLKIMNVDNFRFSVPQRPQRLPLEHRSIGGSLAR